MQLYTVSKYPEILLSYDGQSKVLKKGVAELIQSVSPTYFNWVLHKKKLFKWCSLSLFREVYIWKIHEDPIQVVSRSVDKVIRPFEVPPSTIVASEIEQFIQWANDTTPGEKIKIQLMK